MDAWVKPAHDELESGAGLFSYCIQSRQQILDDVVGMLEPDRQAHQAVADAEFGALLGLQSLVRRRGRMGNQALGVAEIVRDPHQPERVLKPESPLLAA